MRAAVLHEAPGDLMIEDLDIASPTGREVLIRTKASGPCPHGRQRSATRPPGSSRRSAPT